MSLLGPGTSFETQSREGCQEGFKLAAVGGKCEFQNLTCCYLGWIQIRGLKEKLDLDLISKYVRI